jgi:ribosomal-protein-alanine N-acetyltransferase
MSGAQAAAAVDVIVSRGLGPCPASALPLVLWVSFHFGQMMSKSPLSPLPLCCERRSLSGNGHHIRMGGYFLQSSRLGFRCWRDADVELAMDLWGDPAVTRYISARGYTPQEVQARLQLEIETQRTHGVQYWPIFLLATGEHVGCCGFRPRQIQPGTLELGVHVASRYWKQGYAVESASCGIEYAFTLDGIESIFAGHNPDNIASRRLLARLGFAFTHDEFYAPTNLLHPSYLLHKKQARLPNQAVYDRAL